MGDETRRVYQYETEVFEHFGSLRETTGIFPKKGEWVVQEKQQGCWRNIDGPWATQDLAERALQELQQG